MKKLLPKFLTKEVAEVAVKAVWNAVKPCENGFLKRNACHIVILVQEIEVSEESDVVNIYPNCPIRPYVLFEKSIKGDVWTADYTDIARCKALQLWQERNDDRTDIIPHLLFPGDSPFYGGVKRGGIVVACAGVQSWFDKMISGMIADMCIALAYDAWMTSKDKLEKLDYLS